MKHAGPDALDRLESVLRRLREIPKLTERSRGVFYCSSKAFLHFHEDPTGLYADLRRTESFERFPMNSRAEKDEFLRLVSLAVAKPGER
ncbi:MULTISPECIES: hypothetical protein [Burkholderia]|uniref:hypothetical protein n=1 Tax=Burkholderia TaxID=32008 RepID=UPI0009306C9E|nr:MULTISPECIES: hypothetical protein [Burkholderia]